MVFTILYMLGEFVYEQIATECYGLQDFIVSFILLFFILQLAVSMITKYAGSKFKDPLDTIHS